MKIVLASLSPRRKALLEQLNIEFEIIASNIEEKIEASMSPEEVVKSLAYQKAKNVAEGLKQDCLVIGADTIVVIDDKILGKPSNEQDAYDMLRLLSNREHRVITGVCIVNSADNTYYVENDVSYIKMREISDNEIKEYIKNGEPFDKAGSYAIQGLSGIFVEKINGSYSGIVGLPVYIVDKLLKKFGVKIL